MLFDQLTGCRLTPAATPTHGQLHLHFPETAGALLDGAADLAVGNSMAQTDIHRSPLTRRQAGNPGVGATLIRMRMIVN
jgi:hypothetical protein